jgi:glutathione S-transferase
MLTLYTTPLSANGRKVLALTLHLGLEADLHEVNVYRGEGQAPEFLALQPTGKIPLLVEGDFRLSESNAILQYLAEACGDFELFSRDPKERAMISSWMFWESAHWQPTLSTVLASLVGHRLLPDMVPAPVSEPDWGHGALAPLLSRLDRHLEESRCLVGGRITIADFSVAGMTTYFRAAGFPFSEFAALSDWYARIEALAAWQDTAVPPWG